MKGQTTSSQQCSVVVQNGKKCPNFCREEGFFILPVRYSVATTVNTVKALPKNLGQNVSQIGLTKHKYTIQMIDRGYIYVFFKRGKVCGHVCVSESALQNRAACSRVQS